MDLDEWEFLPVDGFIDFHHDHEDDKKGLIDPGFDRKGVFDMNYFICPTPNSRRLIENPPKNSSVKKGMNQVVVPVSIHLEPKEEKKPEEEIVKEITKFPILEIKAPNLVSMGEDQDTVSQVFFKKMKENEFVDMKLDSPKSGSRGIKAQTETALIQFEEKEEVYNKSDQTMENNKTCSKIDQTEQEMKNYLDSSNIIKEESGGGGLNIWKWRLTGIGALCSIGLTAATICIFILGSPKQHKFHQQNQKIRIQFFAEDKRIKQVVHHATKLNQAISAVRGVPLTRAHITFGGYYDGL